METAFTILGLGLLGVVLSALAVVAIAFILAGIRTMRLRSPQYRHLRQFHRLVMAEAEFASEAGGAVPATVLQRIAEREGLR